MLSVQNCSDFHLELSLFCQDFQFASLKTLVPTRLGPHQTARPCGGAKYIDRGASSRSTYPLGNTQPGQEHFAAWCRPPPRPALPLMDQHTFQPSHTVLRVVHYQQIDTNISTPLGMGQWKGDLSLLNLLGRGNSSEGEEGVNL